MTQLSFYQDELPETPPAAPPALRLALRERRYRVFGGEGWEVTPRVPCATVPGACPWLQGLVMHKGQALPLLDLALALDPDAAAAAADGPMLVARCGGVTAAFLVDDVDADDGSADAVDLDLDGLVRDLLAAGAAA